MKLHLIAWKNTCLPKINSRLGFLSIQGRIQLLFLGWAKKNFFGRGWTKTIKIYKIRAKKFF
ncbi:hypothetical protein KFK09_003737 [Dendrobium nobile]|uniref:Uncharacterized protein n=1 Tax=Dendrobium nobile TaxID=94219 RepID=A0A8T3C243_DENNO|nr:hypothetical protein KFK09_003737 [Dendrobium nobile]